MLCNTYEEGYLRECMNKLLICLDSYWLGKNLQGLGIEMRNIAIFEIFIFVFIKIIFITCGLKIFVNMCGLFSIETLKKQGPGIEIAIHQIFKIYILIINKIFFLCIFMLKKHGHV